MDGLKHLSIVLISLAICISCATSSDAPSGSSEDLSALDSPSSGGTADPALESDLKQTEAKPAEAAAQEPAKDEFAQFDSPPPAAEPQSLQPVEQAPPPPQAEVQPPPQPEVAPPTPEVAPPPVVQAEPPKQEPPPPPPQEMQSSGGPVHLKQLLFKGNDNGGTIVLEADGPMTYSSRMNFSTGQFVLDVPNSILPKKIKLPYITKDFESMIGGIDAYQARGTNVSRIVIHMKSGATEPIVQAEGSSIMVVASERPAAPPPPPPKEEVKLLSYSSLQDFLNGNMNFSGKKISIETDDIEIRDLFKLIGEEAGINLMIGDEVKGTMSVKLRQVPWDQALVMILKSKKLGYHKDGNILRIVSVADLRAEEKEMIESAKAKMAIDPLIVKVIPINYAKIDEISKQIEPFLTKERGSVRGDTRTNAIVVSDVDEVIKRVTKLIQAIDIPPQQVLIEGKIVEAQDTFENQLGISWSSGGVPSQAGGSSVGGPVAAQGTVAVSPSAVGAPTMSLGYSIGVLDVLGSLNMMLNLQETEGKVKILSSPRVLALHNQKATISQIQQIPITTSTPSANGAPPSVKVEYKDVKLELNVTPQITNDGAVMMEVDVKREFAGATTDPKSAPPVYTRSSSTKALVRNGQTSVIGGIYQDDYTDSESRVPWLGQIPLFGWLFKSKKVSDIKNELLIFLTPRILAQFESGGSTTGQNIGIDSGNMPSPSSESINQ